MQIKLISYKAWGLELYDLIIVDLVQFYFEYFWFYLLLAWLTYWFQCSMNIEPINNGMLSCHYALSSCMAIV